MKEIEYSEWVEGNYIKSQYLKKGDVLKIRSKLYIVTLAYKYDDCDVYDVYAQSIYYDYKDYRVYGCKDYCIGKLMHMPSIDISDPHTASAYEDLCTKRVTYLTKAGTKANKGKAMRLSVLENFSSIAHEMGIMYYGIKYTDYVMPFKRIQKVPTNLWETYNS